MLRRIICIALLIVIGNTCSLYAQVSDKKITEEFFKLYAIDPMKALDYAFSTNKWMERNPDAVESLKNQFYNVLPLIGNYNGYELITERNIGNNLKLASFMTKYDRQPIRWTFILYKPKDKWQVQNLKYDDKLGDELEESVKNRK